MIEAIAAVAKEVAEASEVSEVVKVAKLKDGVLKPDIGLIQTKSLESVKGIDITKKAGEAVPQKEIPKAKGETSNTVKETKNNYFSTYEERFNQTPVNGGEWSGKRGESKFRTEDKEANKYLKKVNVDGIKYNDCIPNFKEVSKGNVKIADMSESRPRNFRQADEQLAAKKGCTPREVSEWRERNDYTWHECNDMKTCQKVPRSVNASFGHLGGVSEVKKFKMESEFDV